VKLTIPDPSLVLLVGPSGAGKSTFAQTHFRPTEILSSDGLRAILAGDANDQAASGEAFHVLALLLNGRLKRRLLTVIDATNLRDTSRRRWLGQAARYGIPTVAIAFDLADQTFEVHNVARPDRQVETEVVRNQADRMEAAMAALPSEGYSQIYVLRDPPALGEIEIVRVRGVTGG
jgi:protein phosphatase